MFLAYLNAKPFPLPPKRYIRQHKIMDDWREEAATVEKRPVSDEWLFCSSCRGVKHISEMHRRQIGAKGNPGAKGTISRRCIQCAEKDQERYRSARK